MAQRKIFAGAQMRAVRAKHQLTQRQLAERLEVSTSYVNQIENNQRPLTAPIMLVLAERFQIDLAELMSDKADRVLADLLEILADPLFADKSPSLIEVKNLTTNAPDTAHAMLRLYAAYQKANEQLASVDAALASAPAGGIQTAYEEVRDFFHYADNYVDDLDRSAESLAGELGPARTGRLDRLFAYMRDEHEIKVEAIEPARPDMLRHFDRATRTLTLNGRMPLSSQFFQAGAQLALMEQTTSIARIIAAAGFKTTEAADICRIGLANYFAGALQMPYSDFLSAAEAQCYDLDELGYLFRASKEQVGHRLSTMQRPKARGIPFFFARVDAAGTITKRHSATPLQFARFGGACPLWNVHSAFEAHGQLISQLAETPDGHKYLCLAWSSQTQIGGFHGPKRTYAYALGCEIAHAQKLTYARDLDLHNARSFDPIGVSCRLCPRTDCAQRAVPPIAATLTVDTDRRSIVPYEIG